MSLPIPPVPTVTDEGFASHTWQRWFELLRNGVRSGQDGGSQFGLSSGSSLIGWIQSGTGAILRTLQDKNREIISVADLGAVGDGIADDTPAFVQASLDFPGNPIKIPGGKTYKLTSSISAYWQEEDGVTYSNSKPLFKKRGFYSDSPGGVNIKRIPDRLLVGQATLYDGSRSSGIFGWIGNLAGGIYAYLASSATVYATNDGPFGGVAITGAARDGGATLYSPSAASIAIAAFGWQDVPGSTGGVWGLYSTVVREAGAGNATHGQEIDIANKGVVTQIFPSAMFPSGLTSGLWLCSGGEITESIGGAGLAKTASVGLGVVSNDPTNVANFAKGIVFHSRALLGTDGITGEGVAIAFAKGHRQDWYNSSNQLVGSITSTGTDATLAHRLQFDNLGLLLTNQQTGNIQMSVVPIPLAANYLQLTPAIAGNAPVLKAAGTDANIDLYLAPTGTGLIRSSYGVGVATVPSAFSPVNWLAFKDGNGNTIYLAGRLSPW